MQPFDLEKHLRTHIQSLKPYASARHEYAGVEGIFLDANENPFGSTETAAYMRYPDPYQQTLKARLSVLKGIDAAHIFLGNGSDEVIDLLMRLFCEPQADRILIMPPTYGMYAVNAAIHRIGVLEVPLSESYALRPEKVLKSATPNTKICFICSPNNPTGNALDVAHILEIVENFEGIVVLDEAYIDFSGEASFVGVLEKYPNLVVLQTFSKAWGLAGLRLGMAFASTQIIGYLNKIKAPYNLGRATQEIALKNLANQAQKEIFVQKICKLRESLSRALQKIPLVEKVYPSDANFLLVKITDADRVYRTLVERKVIVRNQTNVPFCGGCLRISVGTPAENAQLLDELAGLQSS